MNKILGVTLAVVVMCGMTGCGQNRIDEKSLGSKAPVTGVGTWSDQTDRTNCQRSKSVSNTPVGEWIYQHTVGKMTRTTKLTIQQNTTTFTRNCVAGSQMVKTEVTTFNSNFDSSYLYLRNTTVAPPRDRSLVCGETFEPGTWSYKIQGDCLTVNLGGVQHTFVHN